MLVAKEEQMQSEIIGPGEVTPVRHFLSAFINHLQSHFYFT